MGHFLSDKLALIYKKNQNPEIIYHKKLLFSDEEIEKLFTEKKIERNDIKLFAEIKQKETEGFILIGEKMNKRPYDSRDQDFLNHVATNAAASFKNSLLFIETIEKQKMEEELNLAKKIQAELLPQKMPSINNFDLFASNQTSKKVGGDYFDILKLDEKNFAFVIADVSGKGAAAALLMSNLQASFHAHLFGHSENLEEIVDEINSHLVRNTSSDKFITGFFGIINTESGKLRYVNAGHNYPLVYRNNEFIELKEGGLILGMMIGIGYSSEEIQLEKNDSLILYTDGINEAPDLSGDEEYEMERFCKSIEKNNPFSAKKMHDELLKDVFEFSPHANDFDDITLMVFKYKK
jgi:sigma-B regulation protein RsbU (phosphoserine phosphatase)